MKFFIDLPSNMTAEHYEKLNIGLINCFNHILRSGRIWAEDKVCFINKLKDYNKKEYKFVTQAIDAMLNAPIQNQQVQENLIYLGKMLVGSQQALTDARCLTNLLYHSKLILNWTDVVKRLSNPEINIHDDEELIKEFNQKIKMASAFDKTDNNSKDL